MFITSSGNLAMAWYSLDPDLCRHHYTGVIMGAMSSQITSPIIVYSTRNLGRDQRKHQSSASLAFMRGIHRWPVNSPHKWPVTRKMFPFDDVIMMWRHKATISKMGLYHYSDAIMSVKALQITGVSIVCSTVCPGADKIKTLKCRVTGLCEGNLPVTGGFPSRRVSNAENVSIWWRHHDFIW